MFYLGNKQLFEITNGAKLFFNAIACFMLRREIVETAFFRGLRNWVSMRTAGVFLKVINLQEVYGGNLSWSSGPYINTAVVLVNLS